MSILEFHSKSIDQLMNEMSFTALEQVPTNLFIKDQIVIDNFLRSNYIFWTLLVTVGRI